jgi:hypothetical protein
MLMKHAVEIGLRSDDQRGTCRRAEADPLFTRPQVADLVAAYLGGADPKLSVAFGDDEVLLDDSLQYGERAIAAGVDDAWTCGRAWDTVRRTSAG